LLFHTNRMPVPQVIHPEADKSGIFNRGTDDDRVGAQVLGIRTGRLNKSRHSGDADVLVGGKNACVSTPPSDFLRRPGIRKGYTTSEKNDQTKPTRLNGEK
jgi:hypothetical protein